MAFDSLRSAELRVKSAVPAFVAREIPNTNFRNVGTVRVLAKPKPLVQHVGSIENHPRNKINVELMEQKALRNMADLPTLLSKLQQIGNPAAHCLQTAKQFLGGGERGGGRGVSFAYSLASLALALARSYHTPKMLVLRRPLPPRPNIPNFHILVPPRTHHAAPTPVQQ